MEIWNKGRTTQHEKFAKVASKILKRQSLSQLLPRCDCQFDGQTEGVKVISGSSDKDFNTWDRREPDICHLELKNTGGSSRNFNGLSSVLCEITNLGFVGFFC